MKRGGLTGVWLLWTALLAAGIGARFWQIEAAKPKALPLPIAENVQIIRAGGTIELQKTGDHWTLAGQPAARFAAWLDGLKTGCQPLPEAAADTAMDAPITLRFIGKAGNDDWIFGAHNDLSKAHYVKHGSAWYLCNEQLKPRLSLPENYWTQR